MCISSSASEIIRLSYAILYSYLKKSSKTLKYEAAGPVQMITTSGPLYVPW